MSDGNSITIRKHEKRIISGWGKIKHRQSEADVMSGTNVNYPTKGQEWLGTKRIIKRK